MIQRAIIAGLTSTGVHVADLRISPAAVTRHVLKTQGLAGGRPRRALERRPRGRSTSGSSSRPGNQMTVALAEGGREALQPPGAPPRDVRGGGGDDLPGARPRQLRAGHPRLARRRVDPRAAASAWRSTTATRPRRSRCRSCSARSASRRSAPAGSTPRTRRRRSSTPIDARRIVIGVRADLGVVLDRAAERLVVVDERGEAVPAELGLLLVVRLLALAGRRGGSRCRSPRPASSSSSSRARGSTVVRTPHSLSELTRAATEDGVVLAAAPTGGFVFPDVVPGYDAVTALCKLLELLATQERPVSELVAELPRPTLVHRALPCPWGRKGLVMRLLNEQLATRRLDLIGRRQGLRRPRLGAGRPRPGRAARAPLRRGGDRGAHRRARRRGRGARRDGRAGRRRTSSEPWSKPQAEVDPSAARLLQSVVPRRKVPESPWTRFPILPA